MKIYSNNLTKTSHSTHKSGFTLAETLITIVIVGVVAALTVPSMIARYHREQTVTKLKKAYSEIAQAIRLAEFEYGTMNSWDFGDVTSGLERSTFFAENYLFKNLKIMKKCIPTSSECYYNDTSGSHVSAVAVSGYSMLVWVDARNIGGWIYVDINGPTKGKHITGKDVFPIKFIYKNGGLDAGDNSTKFGVWQSGLQYTEAKTREELISGNYCGALIQYDSWQIKDDNPCW